MTARRAPRRLPGGAGRARTPRRFAPICAADVHYEDPLTQPLTGPDELAAHAAAPVGRRSPTRAWSRPARGWSSGDHVAAPMKLVATHRGELEGLPPTGRFLVAQPSSSPSGTPKPDLLWRVRAFFDAYGAGVQLGVLPEPGSLGGKALLMLRGFGLRSRT